MMLVLDRGGETWIERRLNKVETYRTGRLPGFELVIAALFRPPG